MNQPTIQKWKKLFSKHSIILYILYIIVHINKEKILKVIPTSISTFINSIPLIRYIGYLFLYATVYYYNQDLLQSLLIVIGLIGLRLLTSYINQPSEKTVIPVSEDTVTVRIIDSQNNINSKDN